MFGKSSSPSPTPGNSTTFIAHDCEITGTINIKGSARIDGKVEGAIICNGDLSIGTGARLFANIDAKTVSIAGEVTGDIKAGEYLELSSTAKLYGDIYTKQLKIDQGAVFIGTSHQSKDAIVVKPVTLDTAKDEFSVGTTFKSEFERKESDDESVKTSKKDKRR